MFRALRSTLGNINSTPNTAQTALRRYVKNSTQKFTTPVTTKMLFNVWQQEGTGFHKNTHANASLCLLTSRINFAHLSPLARPSRLPGETFRYRIKYRWRYPSQPVTVFDRIDLLHFDADVDVSGLIRREVATAQSALSKLSIVGSSLSGRTICSRRSFERQIERKRLTDKFRWRLVTHFAMARLCIVTIGRKFFQEIII